MATRRAFVSGLLAAGVLPAPSWADAGAPAFLSAARTYEGRYALFGLSGAGARMFQHPLPARGHAAAAHPIRPEAVAFARRPGTFALVLDCVTGNRLHQLDAPEGRHFYGHGAFSKEGDLLFTTENDYAHARGVIGIWDARRGYTRIGEMASGGTGPHDIKLLPSGDALVVANGGIETHPETGRSKLNIPTMRPALSYVSLDGAVLERIELPPAHQKNSIRHLAVSETGTVAFAMQWQGDLTEDLPLLGLHNRSRGALELAEAASIRALQGYLGSVAVSADGRRIAVTSPRKGVMQIYEGTTLAETHDLPDVCGVASTQGGFIATTGQGLIHPAAGASTSHPHAWDNHLIAL